MKLPVISARECIRALERGVFYIARQKGSHVIMRRDKPSGRAVVPDHKELRVGTLHSILEQARVSDEEFLEWLNS
jgi:predicted RNA binding protein YcfA (HicA-like mRNA interferase family)